MAMNYRNKPQKTHAQSKLRLSAHHHAETVKNYFLSSLSRRKAPPTCCQRNYNSVEQGKAGGKSDLAINFFKGILNYPRGATKPDLELVNCI